MRAVRYVGPGVDDEHLIVEAADDGEQFALIVSPELRSATRSVDESDAPDPSHRPDISLAPPTSATPAASIPPREIQSRVRAGQTPAAVAEDTGMPLDRVLRFAAAVLDERSRLADEARRARARRNAPDGPLVVFGETVDARFAAHGIDPASVRWDAHRQEDSEWVVAAQWIGGDAERHARWAFSLGSRMVSPLDETAADLLSERPIRPIRPIIPPVPPVLKAVPTGEPDTETRPLPESIVRPLFAPTTPAPAPRDWLTGPPMPHPASLPPRPVLEPVSGSKAASKAAPAAELPGAVSDASPLSLADQLGPQRPVPAQDRPEPPQAASAPEPPHAVAALPLQFAQPLPDTPAPPRREESDEERAARARIPSWDDILLGVRRKRD
jgi:Protein of unknown function (DUF3071)